MKKVTPQQAAQIAARYYGQKCEVQYNDTPGYAKWIIDGEIIYDIENKQISFIKIHTRTIDGMTDAEKDELRRILFNEDENIEGIYARDIQGDMIHWTITPDRVHFLESIGIRFTPEELEFEIE